MILGDIKMFNIYDCLLKNEFNTYELQPYDHHKSFYKKAYVYETDEWYFLKSYETYVCGVRKSNMTIYKLWDDYSTTTMRHINAFLTYLGCPDGGKRWWDALPLEKPVKLSDISSYFINEVYNIVDMHGGRREKSVINKACSFYKVGMWSEEHKLIEVLKVECDRDDHRDGFIVDIQTEKIVG